MIPPTYSPNYRLHSSNGALAKSRCVSAAIKRSRIIYGLVFVVVLCGSLLASTTVPPLQAHAHNYTTTPVTFSDLDGDNDFTPNLLNATVQSSGCRRRCLDPHPGAFRSWYGQQNGCWIQVWRSWPEGCQHYQWFNSCNGYWDSYPNGAPRVYWNCCVH